MPTLPDSSPPLKSSVVAALLLVAHDQLRDLGATLPDTAGEAITLAGSSRSQAYEMKRRLLDACAGLPEQVGRPRRAVGPGDGRVAETLRAVRDWLFDHPGAVTVHANRRDYTESFRRFVVSLTAPGAPASGLAIRALADAVGVPAGTLKDWLRRPNPAPDPPADVEEPVRDDPLDTVPAVDPDVTVIVLLWPGWTGGFTAFCDHLKTEHGVKRGKTFVSTVLQAAGLRTPTRRGGPKSAPWSRDTFRRIFPGAQWLADGTELAIELDGQRFVFNLEAVVDAHTNAAVGVDVRDTENEDALLAAFHNGLVTTGDHPVGLTVDGKPSNHTDLVRDSIAPTDVVPATPGRGQAKAPVEGSFGLFEQTAPPLVVGGNTARELARSMLALCCTIWLWARNGRPRRRLGGRSPADVYRDRTVEPEQLDEARRWIAELSRRADKARRTAEARADPVRRALLREGLERLGIDDPNGRLEVDLARYAEEAIVRGLATFAAKQEAGTVPNDAEPGRYLGGIIRKLSERLELQVTADRLLELRLRHRDLTLDRERAVADRLVASTPHVDLPAAFVERAITLDHDLPVAFRFYARCAVNAVRWLPAELKAPLVAPLIRRVSAAFGVDRDDRADLIARLTAAAV